MKKAFFSITLVLSVLLITVTFAENKQLTVLNKSGVNVTSITVSQEGDFAGSQTFSNRVQNGEKFTINFNANTDNCVYNVNFTDDKGNVYTMSSVELCNSNEIILTSNKADEVQQIFQRTK